MTDAQLSAAEKVAQSAGKTATKVVGTGIRAGFRFLIGAGLEAKTQFDSIKTEVQDRVKQAQDEAHANLENGDN